MPLTHADLARLLHGTGLPAEELIEWLPTSEVNLTGEPGSLVVLDRPEQRALMVLKQADGACSLLDADGRCGAYEVRPASCRLFPFDPSFGRRGGLRRLRLLGGTRCDYARDGQTHAHALREADERRWSEHRAYLARIHRWNRAQQRRERFGHSLLGAREFLRFLLD